MSMQHVLDVAVLSHLGGDKKIPAGTKLALMAIADDASEHTNLSYPGIDKICAWANVKERQALNIISDLVAAGLIERVSAASPGRRAVYLVTVPPRPRKPVDNPENMGAADRTHSDQRLQRSTKTPAAGRTPLRISPEEETGQSSSNAPQQAAAMTTDRSLHVVMDPEAVAIARGFKPENVGILQRLFGRAGSALDREKLSAGMRERFPELVDEPTFDDRVDELATEILRKAAGRVLAPTAYVLRAFDVDPQWPQRFHQAFGRYGDAGRAF